MIRHPLPLLIRRGAIHIPAPAPHPQHNDPRDWFALILSQEERRPVAFTVQAHNVLVMILLVNHEMVALAGRLVDAIKSIKIGLSLASPYRYPLAACQRIFVAPFLFQMARIVFSSELISSAHSWRTWVACGFARKPWRCN